MINKKNNILITGGAGYIGSRIVEDLIKKKIMCSFSIIYPLALIN